MKADILAFREDLTTLINKHSIENLCDTPDYVLSNFLCDSLLAFAQGTISDRKHKLISEEATRRKMAEVDNKTKEEE